MKTCQCLESPVAEPELIDVKRLAVMLQKSVSSIFELRSSGRLPDPVRLGGSVRWRRKEIELWVLADCPPRHRWQEMKSEAAKIQAALHPCPN
jgi:predicted DNA-binding transcriptional regulator AlpA